MPVRVTLIQPRFLMPDLVRSLTDAGFIAGVPEVDVVEVAAPWISDSTEAAARVSVVVNAWAALHGAEVTIDPPATRIAHPASRYGGYKEGAASALPSVSIGLPVRNGARFLEEALHSLVEQTYGDLEILVCDNGSTDDTVAIAQSFAARDERVSVFGSAVNRGAAWNYNRALTLASGRYFKWAAHDDVLARTYIERCVEVLDRAPESVVLTYPKTVIVDEAGQVVRSYEDGLDLRQSRAHTRVSKLIRNLVMSNAVFGLMRTDVVRRTRGHGSYISADYVLLAELALTGQFWEIPEPLFFRREHRESSRAKNRTPIQIADWFDPGSGDETTTEFLRLFVEYLRAVRHARLGSLETLAVYGSTVPLWLRRFHRGMREELVRQLRHPRRARRDRPTRPDFAAREVLPMPIAQPPQQMDVRELIRSVVWEVAPDYMRHVRIEVDRGLQATLDRGAVETVLKNLVSNAVRYGDVPITVSARAGDELVFTVDDSGRGIDAAFLPHLFEPFARSERSRSEAEGAGLGLAVARLAAEASGGRVTYEPRLEGARFRLVYPGGVATSRPPRERDTRGKAPAVRGRGRRSEVVGARRAA